MSISQKLYVIPYSFKSIPMSQEEQLATARKIGFDGLEGGTLTDEYIALLKKYDASMVHGALIRKEDGTADPENVARLKEWGCEVVSVRDEKGPGFDFRKMFEGGYKGMPGAFGTYDMAVEAAKKANVDAEFAAKYGFKTYFHNHTHEFRVDRGEYILDTYLKNTIDAHVMELDVGWALCAGIDVIEFMRRWKGRIGALHLKSCNWSIGPEALGMSCPVPPLEVGISDDQRMANQTYAESPQGPMELSICNWKEIIDVAEECGCHTFIIERERVYNEPKDVIACLQNDHDVIRKAMED